MTSLNLDAGESVFSFQEGHYEIIRVPGDFLKLPFSVLNPSIQRSKRAFKIKGKRTLPRNQGEIQWSWQIAGTSVYGLPGPKEEALLSIIQRFDSLKFFQTKQDPNRTSLEILDDEFFGELYGKVPSGTNRKAYRKRLTEAILCLAGTTYYSERAFFAAEPGKSAGDPEDPDILFSRGFHLFEVERVVFKHNPDANRTVFQFSHAWCFLQRQRYATPVNYDFLRFLRSKDLVAYRCYQILELESYKARRVLMDLEAFCQLVPLSLEDPKQGRAILQRGLDVLQEAGYLTYPNRVAKGPRAGQGTPFLNPRRNVWRVDVVVHQDKRASFSKPKPAPAQDLPDGFSFLGSRLQKAGMGTQEIPKILIKLREGVLTEPYVLEILRWVDLHTQYGTQPWFQESWKVKRGAGAFLSWALQANGVAHIPEGLMEAGENALQLQAREEYKKAFREWEIRLYAEQERLTGAYWAFVKEQEKAIPSEALVAKIEEMKQELLLSKAKWPPKALEELARVKASKAFRQSFGIPEQTVWVEQNMAQWKLLNPRPSI